MKKIILLAAVLLGLGAANASAYSHSVVNKSKYTIRFWVNYKACSNDSWDLKPGQTVTWRSGACCISDAHSKGAFGASGVNRPHQLNDGEEFGRQIFDMIGMGGFFRLLCGNSNWATDAEWLDDDNYGLVHLQRI